MENLLALLPFLACPLMMMGFVVWMMRGQQSQTPNAKSPVEMRGRPSLAPTHSTETQRAEPAARPTWRSFGLCLNWKVVAALGMVALAVWVVAPSLLWAALPVLVLAACPISMVFMMRGMQGTQCAPESPQRSQIAAAALTRDAQLAELQGRLASLRAEEAGLAREMADLERQQTPVERQAKAAARGANGRGGS